MTTQAIAYRCPHCRQAIEIDESLLNDVIQCPNTACGLPFHIEAPEATVVSTAQLADESVIDLKSNPRDPEQNGIGDASENMLATIHPSMLRARPLKFLGLAVLLAIGAAGLITWSFSARGLVVNEAIWLTSTPLLILSSLLAVIGGGWLFVWWLQTRCVTLHITSVRSLLKRGMIARQTSEVRHSDVRNIQVDQNVYQRLVGVGDIAISSSGQDGLEITIAGVPHPDGVADRIRELQ